MAEIAVVFEGFRLAILRGGGGAEVGLAETGFGEIVELWGGVGLEFGGGVGRDGLCEVVVGVLAVL